MATISISATIESSDEAMLELLRQRGSLGISELANAMQVTATAVRQRLNRLTGEGMILRNITKSVRGRPSHKYSLTEKARRKTENNFADLALAMWDEIRAVKDAEVRSGLLQRLAKRLAASYSSEIAGTNPTERMYSIRDLFRGKDIPFLIEFASEAEESTNGNLPHSGEAKSVQLPILTALACPYPSLAEHDRGICALENMMLTELVGERVKLTDCRLDGASCCRFQSVN